MSARPGPRGAVPGVFAWGPVRRATCTILWGASLQYQDFQQCGSCFLQRVLERDMPTVSTCPVCYEDNKESSVKELSCKHLMCTWCYAKLPEPKKCPLCRALDIT